MSASLIPIFYAAVAIATLWLGLLCCTPLKHSRRARIVKTLFGVATVLLLFIPINGLPLWSRAFSVFPNPSFPMLGIVCAALWQRLLGIAVFKPADWRAIWVFGAAVGTVLHLQPLMVGAIDLYYWGWERETAAWILAAVAVVLLALGSRLGVLLLAALIGYAVNALESQNCWDYIMDPIYGLISLFVIGQRLFMRASRVLWAGVRSLGWLRPIGAAGLPLTALEAAVRETPPPREPRASQSPR